MSYNRKFNLNVKQLQLIEDALRTEMAVAIREHDLDRAYDLTAILAHLHHQKNWHQPKNEKVPMG